jgi:23S rRNA pseudouridine1911/1915/1917 synthase
MDAYLSEQLPDVSRARLKTCIQDGFVAVNMNTQTKASYTCKLGDIIAGTLPEPPSTTAEPEDIPLVVVYEDEHVLIVNKVAGTHLAELIEPSIASAAPCVLTQR